MVVLGVNISRIVGACSIRRRLRVSWVQSMPCGAELYVIPQVIHQVTGSRRLCHKTENSASQTQQPSQNNHNKLLSSSQGDLLVSRCKMCWYSSER